MSTLSEKSERKTQKSGKDDLEINRILLAVDLSPHSERTATYAANFAKTFGASITLAHVLAVEPVRTLNANETSAEEKRHNAERKLGELVEKIRQTTTPTGRTSILRAFQALRARTSASSVESLLSFCPFRTTGYSSPQHQKRQRMDTLGQRKVSRC